jgi:hypothetical protein
MVDRVYKADLPRLRRSLLKMREEFSKLHSKTNWSTLRVDPLLDHVRSLERIIGSKKFSGEFSRLRKGVVLFHSDLVYLRTNVKALGEILRAEKARLSLKKK